MLVQIEDSWKDALGDEFTKPYFEKLATSVREAYTGTEAIYPPPRFVFKAFELCPFDAVRVVILGQDPYHGAGQAHGLSFSVPEGVRPPPSLKNIYKELKDDLGITPPILKPLQLDAVQGVSEAYDQTVDPYSAGVNERDNAEMRQQRRFESGNLERWATQGVLLLNATLTVAGGKAGSHQGLGWEEFTDAVIQKLSDQKEHLVFILWGRYAQDKGARIDTTKHLVIKSAHPSPFSAYNGFFGSKPFSKTNEYLISQDLQPIVW